MSVYLSLTRAFNEGALRAILSSGQAVVVHRLALMSKDGDRILRERPEALRHVLEVLEKRGARYRFDAPIADLEAALDSERRALIHANEERLAYMDAAADWRSLWPELDRRDGGNTPSSSS